MSSRTKRRQFYPRSFQIVLLCVVIASPLLLGLFRSSAQSSAVTINIDAAANRHAIDPRIYGLAYATTAQLSDLNVQLNRLGGNNTSRYNWQINADNRANDWYYESIPDDSATPGERGDTFVANNKAAGAQSMITIPLVEWIAKLGPNRTKLSSFSIAKYGAQTGSDAQWFPDAGNGVKPGGAYVTGNDPNDANVPNNSTYQQGWINHLTGKFGNAAAGGPRYYLLDNESSIWFGTHRDVQPVGLKMEEMRDRMLEYAAKIKEADPTALVVGPEEWGWGGYLFSGYDQQYGAQHNYSSYPDRAAHNNMDYLPWLLDQFKQNNTSTGKRLLDVFTVHIYPQGGEFAEDVSSAMQLRRNRSTRSLWDPNYVDESWINNKVQLIPRLRNWVNTYYPNTPIGITEYNWGAEGHINGATTQADILGIFGRENLDLAARWTTPATNTPVYNSIKMYRNYDGNKSTFGETSISTTVPNPDNLSSFAALRASDGAMTVMVVNKILSGSTPVSINLSNFNANGNAQAWQLTSGNAITRLSDVTFSGTVITTTVPAQSITLLVVPAAKPITNNIDDASFFVRQQYQDFLSREADPPGLAFWTNEITSCGGDKLCADRKRVNTSGAYFISTEFQSTGYFVYRLYQGALGRQPRFNEFMPDLAQVQSGIVVNNQLSDAAIENNKNTFAAQFLNRAEVQNIYGSLSNAGFVDKLATTRAVSLSDADRTALISGLDGGTETKAGVLRKLLDGTTTTNNGQLQFTTTYGSKAFYDKEYNPAFVLMQYFGYLRRDPDADGYAFWLKKLNDYKNFIDAEMVRSFIISDEYRKRFGTP